MQKEPYCHPEIWGGIECTINRIGDRYSDQLASTGHYGRYSDIDLLADLGIKAMRYPVLWESHQRERQGAIQWSWAARQLETLRHRDVTPIVGLLHHGSGPAFTHLGSPDFATGLADYARQVAERFPWVEYYTPVNEPLTTARFSGLYGIWYPHHRDPRECMVMLMNQLKATVLAMRAIRVVNPDAKLIQTEDLAKTHSSPELAYQADFENHRRWLTFDFLHGMVTKTHPLWNYLLSIGIDEADLDFFIENPCPPDIMGLNYYVTSERFLDTNTGIYPVEKHGGNGIDTYVDTEAVRVCRTVGILSLLREAWERYKCPMAITEAHLNCTREEQLRWIRHIWDECVAARGEGIDIRAVTAWALLGACDWDSLLTETNGNYESGAFDISGSVPRITAVGHLVKGLASGAGCDHPLLSSHGWWQRHLHAFPSTQGRLCIIGEKQDGNCIVQHCLSRSIPYQRLAYPASEALQYITEGPHSLPWGIISISAEADERKVLAAGGRRLYIPYLDIKIDNNPTSSQLNRTLDLFIDKALASFYQKHFTHVWK